MRSILRHRVRGAMAIFSSMMGSGLLVSGFMLFGSQDYLVEFQFERLNRSDFEIALRDEQGIEVVDEIRHLAGVDYAEPVFHLGCTLTNGSHRQRIGIQGIQRDAFLTAPRDQRGQPLTMPEVGLVLGDRVAQNLGVRPGDQLTLTPNRGDRRPVIVPVAAVSDSYLGLTAYADLNYLSRLVGESQAVSHVQILTDPRPDAQAALFAELKQAPGIQTVTDRRVLIESLHEALLEAQWVMIVSITSFSGVIFLGSIVNASMVNLAERLREVATLRAIGYSEWRIGNLFLRESLTTAMAGTLLGMPVGFLLVWWLSLSFDTDLARLPLILPIWCLPLTLILAVVFALLAHAVVQRSIFKLNYLDALNIKE